MASSATIEHGRRSTPQRLAAPYQPEEGAYILRKLASNLPLSADGTNTNVRITCVEVWNGNLYVGTSAAELIHFVLLPPESNDPDEGPTAIQASRFSPPFNHDAGVGVQQVLLLPTIYKACILCNNHLSFYSLPELSPLYKPFACTWVGGVDLNDDEQNSADDGVVVMIGIKSRIRLVRIFQDENPRVLKNVDYGGCLASVRRDNLSCAADSHSYALLDLEHPQKIGLFPISSLDPQAGGIGSAPEDIATSVPSHTPSRSVSSASTHHRGALQDEQRGHSRSTSLGIFGTGSPATPRTESPRRVAQRYGFDVPESLSRSISPAPGRSPERVHPERTSSLARTNPPSPDKPLPPPPPPLPEDATAQEAETSASHHFVPLKPHLASPSPSEFLLTVGTTPSEPGVGMFVNLEGDMCRGSIQFSSYPESIVVDGAGIDMSTSTGPDMNAEEGYVLAVVGRQEEEETAYGVEMQRWDVDPAEGEASKSWLNLTSLGPSRTESGEFTTEPLGIRTIVEATTLTLPEIANKLLVRRLGLSPTADSTEAVQEKGDREFTERLARIQTRIVIWVGNQIFWTLRNPMVLRLDARLQEAQVSTTGDGRRIQPNRELLERLLGDVRGQEPRDETEYLSLIYIRQKASILLFMELILRSSTNIVIFEKEKRVTELALTEGAIDPRVVVSLLPILHTEVVQGPDGIQISGGITTLVEQFLQQNDLSSMAATVNGPFGDNLLQLVKRYLQFWKRKKGEASVTNDPYVYQTVDAALLHIMLLLDQDSPKGPASAGSLRAELNDLVDNHVDCFDRAIELLEQFKRLYVLSRFYQGNSKASAKASKVLATWRRILDGETDEGGEFVDGEVELRKYLSRIRDQSLVEEYGAWLANRNPKLGVQIFADDHGRVKFEPTRAVALLKERAPGAVKEYLEYLVFGKKHIQYVNELIAFYLDTVIIELNASDEAKSILLQTYETYRILQPPKPTYRQFITDNAIDAEWWNSRLRLLQLLGSNQPATSSYNVPAILARLEPFEQELVPEMIILNGRQGRHQEAIRLLTHGLGDFDTAINYCLLGGSSIFRPAGYIPQEEIPSREEQARLFKYLLQECLSLEDLAQRIDRTGELLERFGGWFDVAQVLDVIPNEWSVDVFSGFLIQALRRLVRERSETTVAKALSGSQNLQLAAELVDKMEEMGPTMEREGGVA